MNDYIKEMRKQIGNTPLLCIGCGAIVENECGEVLLQKRIDDGTWGTPGGTMNFNETFIETANREVQEETGLIIKDLSLFGIYSGKSSVVEYPNGDVCFGGHIVFKTTTYSGTLLACPAESAELNFFAKDNLPPNLHPFHAIWIEQWRKGGNTPAFVE
ncbi:MAG: NUDIX hydrolase [Oscillospiraceae bacterium]|nr:NUDIX hydrolase [Oscillospiraceae bacterium]